MMVAGEAEKNDQHKVHVNPRSIYANPFDANLCVFFSLGMMLLCDNEMSFRDTLFPSSFYTNESWSRWFRGLLDDLYRNKPAQFSAVFKGPREHIGAYSFRKGVTSYLSGVPGGPSESAVGRRGNWTAQTSGVSKVRSTSYVATNVGKIVQYI
jgi:hypothetical protein